MSSDERSSSSIASDVGMTTSSTPRRSASSVTSSTIGSEPAAPLPITRRRQPHGMSSASESGVWPYLARRSLDGPFFRFRISPWSITRSCSNVVPSTWIEPNS